MASRSLSPPRVPGRRRRPIPLAALRGFECAARRLSFTLAADELALTQSSISRQIATLERQVGRPLFVRKTRALALTAAGEQLLGSVAPALAAIDLTVDQIRGVHAVPRVSITTYASFASMWLVPRLADFRRSHPGVEIRIDATDRRVDLRAEGVDLAIRRMPASQIVPSDTATLLAEEQVTPALSPQLIERCGCRLEKPGDLLQFTLIDMDDHWSAGRATSWARWFEFAGVRRAEPEGGRMTFSFIDQAAQAAIRGQGAVLGRTPMLADAVVGGQLVTPFPELSLPTGYAYCLVVNPERADAPAVAAFGRWLVGEFARGPQRQS